MKKERFVVVFFKDTKEFESMGSLMKEYIKKGVCFNCSKRAECTSYAEEMLFVGHKIIAFGDNLDQALSLIKMLILDPEYQIISLFDNLKNRLYIHRAYFTSVELQENILPLVMKEYDLLFREVPFSQEYEFHDLRDIIVLSTIKQKIVRN